MDDWQAFIFAAIGGYIIHNLHKIFVEIRAIRLMMNNDRKISNEVTTFDDDDG